MRIYMIVTILPLHVRLSSLPLPFTDLHHPMVFPQTRINPRALAKDRVEQSH